MNTEYEILRCSNCGAELSYSGEGKKIRCLYCNHINVRTEKDDKRRQKYNDMCVQGGIAITDYRFKEAASYYDAALKEYAGQNVPDSQLLEALWGLVCSYYGIVFVKDYYANGVKQIYCLFDLHHITRFGENKEVIRLKEALNNVDDFEIRRQYEDYIKDAEKGIRNCVAEDSKGSKYDCFIACKISRTTNDRHETGVTGESIIAEKLYDELTEEGVRVFYSARSMTSGVEYDGPILSAMLRSEKMVLICGSEQSLEYLETPWVKSEWQRWRYMEEKNRKADGSLILYNMDEENECIALPRDLTGLQVERNYRKLVKDLVAGSYARKEEEKRRREAEEAERIAQAQKDKEDADRAAAAAQAEAAENRREIDELIEKINALEKNAQAQIASNHKEIAFGICGDNLTWTLDLTRTLVISGTGNMANWNDSKKRNELSDIPWYSYRDSIKNVVIESGVTSIGNYAFQFCGNLTGITIPSSVTNIGKGAFNGCNSLTGITIPSSVMSIGDWVFEGCSSFTSITIPTSVTSIGEGAFWGCSNLTSITIPSRITSIGNYAFYQCKSLTSITIPVSVTSIGDWAFSDCKKLRITYEGLKKEWEKNNCTFGNVVFPNDVSWMPAQNADKERTSGTCGANLSWTLDSTGVLTISGTGKMPDYNWNTMPWNSYCNSIKYSNSIKTVVIESGVTNISEYAFENCSDLMSITIPSSVTNIGDSAFLGCASLTSVTIPSSVTSIGNFAFEYCSHLTSIAIPLSITSIGIYAFSGCNSLTSITIPSSVTSIEFGAFSSCNNLTISFRGSRKEWEKLNCDFPNVRFSR